MRMGEVNFNSKINISCLNGNPKFADNHTLTNVLTFECFLYINFQTRKIKTKNQLQIVEILIEKLFADFEKHSSPRIWDKPSNLKKFRELLKIASSEFFCNLNLIKKRF